MSTGLRAVLDTNVVLASQKAPGALSPNAQLLQCWRDGAFTVLYSDDIILEYAEKLIALGMDDDTVRRFLRELRRLGESVTITHFHLRHYPADPDDIAFLLCALNGSATHLVTYDRHLTDLRAIYQAVLAICPPREFLEQLRRAVP